MKSNWTIGTTAVVTTAMLALMLALAHPARSATSMTIEDCVKQALKLNPDLLDAAESIDQAASGVTEARSGYLPQFNFQGSYNFLEKTQRVAFPDPVTGGFIETEIDFTRNYTFQFLLDQPLYTGGRLSSSYNMAKYNRTMAETDMERRQADVALDVARAFYALLLAREAVTVSQEAIDNASEFLRVVKARYDTGEASSFEVMRAEVEVSNLEPILIKARNGIRLSELLIKRTMGVSQDADIDFEGEFKYYDYEITPEEAVEIAMKNRPEMRMADLQATMADASIKLARSGWFPSLGLNFNYDFRMDNLTLDRDKVEDTYAGYLVLSLPIFDGFRTRSQVSQARSMRRQADINKANLKEMIELEVRGVLLDVDAARETLKSQEKNVEMAQEGLDIANERYLQGFATNLEVLDAQLALNTAKRNRLEAVHDLNVAVARALRAMGILLKDFNAGARP